MAITNAQQYKQLVNPPLDGKRPGYRGDAAWVYNQLSNLWICGTNGSAPIIVRSLRSRYYKRLWKRDTGKLHQ